MLAITTLPDGAVDLYADALSAAAVAVVAGGFPAAEVALAPIAGLVWSGRAPMHQRPVTGAPAAAKRKQTPEGVRARVFARDGFTCTYCGGRAIPRNVLVALSDLFPAALPYHRRYRMGFTHPAYWVVAAEADHDIAHALGGATSMENLTTLHAICNTQKSDTAKDLLPVVEPRPAPANWDGLVGIYPQLVAAGNTHGTRHAREVYHPIWLKAYRAAGALSE